MSLVERLKATFGRDDGVERRSYECRECGETFESAKTPERASCPECLSDEVEAG